MTARVMRYKAVQAREYLRYILFFLFLCLAGLAAYSALASFLPMVSTEGDLAFSLLLSRQSVEQSGVLLSQGSISESRYLCLTAFDRFFLDNGTARYMYLNESNLVKGLGYSSVCLFTLTTAFPFLGPALGVFFGYLLFGKDIADGAIKNVFQGGLSRSEAFSGSLLSALLLPLSLLFLAFLYLFLSSIPLFGMSFLIQDGERIVECPSYLAALLSFPLSGIGCLISASMVGACALAFRSPLLCCVLPFCAFVLPLALSFGIAKTPAFEFRSALAYSAMPFSGLMLGCSGGCYAPTYANVSVSLIFAILLLGGVKKAYGRASF